MITWRKVSHASHWVGAVGNQNYEESEKFGIAKCKPSHAPHTLWAAQARRRAGRVWSYQYTLYSRSKSIVHLVGVYPSFDAAKAAAAELHCL